MLNPKLNLNPKLFDEDVERVPTRNGFGDGLMLLGEMNPNVVVLTADLSESTRANSFEEKYPDRFFECGVAEQNMAAIGAGLAVSHKIAFISSYATFSPGKNWETIRTTIVYNQANVKIAGHHSGIMTGPDGATHQATEDIAITRCWPGIEVYVPCDSIEGRKVTVQSAGVEGPVYMKFTREKTPVITTDNTPLDKRVQTFWVSDNPQCTIFATGHMVYQALVAARELEKENIMVDVVNITTAKPLDEEGVLSAVNKTGCAVSAEDHQIMGGLGSAMAEVFAKKRPTPMEFIGLQNTFAESGDPQQLLVKYGMDSLAIKEAVKRAIGRK